MSSIPNDREQFSDQIPLLQEATTDLCWLLNRGYNKSAALSLVGDKFQFTKRQRQVIQRSSCNTNSIKKRNKGKVKELPSTAYIDGFNILITIECALVGKLLLRCRDGLIRDISATHGRYRQMQQTNKAIQLIYLQLQKLGITKLVWFLDRPISNSGNIAKLIREKGMEAQVVNNPDRELCDSQGLVISADGWILENCWGWYPLVDDIIKEHIPKVWIVTL